MGRLIVSEFEGRYKSGKLQWYKLPSGDGGGSFEVAGINERYHEETAWALRRLIDDGFHEKAEAEAASYIIKYTGPVLKFFPSRESAEANPGVEFVLRDCGFNRGAKGAATILQIALGMSDIDGIVGPATRAEFAKQLNEPGAKEVLGNLTKARETYERASYPWKPTGRNESSKFWKGLSNRWAKAHTIANTRFV